MIYLRRITSFSDGPWLEYGNGFHIRWHWNFTDYDNDDVGAGIDVIYKTHQAYRCWGVWFSGISHRVYRYRRSGQEADVRAESWTA